MGKPSLVLVSQETLFYVYCHDRCSVLGLCLTMIRDQIHKSNPTNAPPPSCRERPPSPPRNPRLHHLPSSMKLTLPAASSDASTRPLHTYIPTCMTKQHPATRHSSVIRRYPTPGTDQTLKGDSRSDRQRQSAPCQSAPEWRISPTKSTTVGTSTWSVPWSNSLPTLPQYMG